MSFSVGISWCPYQTSSKRDWSYLKFLQSCQFKPAFSATEVNKCLEAMRNNKKLLSRLCLVFWFRDILAKFLFSTRGKENIAKHVSLVKRIAIKRRNLTNYIYIYIFLFFCTNSLFFLS